MFIKAVCDHLVAYATPCLLLDSEMHVNFVQQNDVTKNCRFIAKNDDLIESIDKCFVCMYINIYLYLYICICMYIINMCATDPLKLEEQVPHRAK